MTKQQIINIAWELVFNAKFNKALKNWDKEKLADWFQKQLSDETQTVSSMGASYSFLKEHESKVEL